MNGEGYAVDQPDGYRFQLWISKEIEKVLKKNECQGKVMSVAFAYHNSWLLDLLRERGDYIKWQQWAHLKMINKEITNRLQQGLADHHDNLNKEYSEDMIPSLVDPVCAFVSVETEEAYNVLCDEPQIDLPLRASLVR